MSTTQEATPWAKGKTASGKMISIGCKLPNGLHMDLNTPGQPLNRVTIKGANSARVIGGYGITENVSEEFFEEWKKKHAFFPPVVNGLIFAHSETKSVESESKSRSKVLNGLEPIDPENPAKGIAKLNAKDSDED